MGELIGGYCLAGTFLALSLFTARLQNRRVAEADAAGDEDRLRDLRRYAEQTWTDYMFAIWALLSVVGGFSRVVRDRPLGWAWFGVAALYALTLATNRRARSRLLAGPSDRGRLDLPARHRAGIATSYKFAAVCATGYVGMRIVQYAFPDDPPTGAIIAMRLTGLAVIVGAIGFVIVGSRTYLRADDLNPDA